MCAQVGNRLHGGEHLQHVHNNPNTEQMETGDLTHAALGPRVF